LPLKIRHIIGWIIFSGIIMLYFIIDPSKVDFMLKCPLYSTTGIYCPGCGIQRALHDLLHLNIIKAAHNNLILLFGIPILFYQLGITVLNKITKKEIKSIFYNTRVLLILLILIVLFWILRNLSTYPFDLLAPRT
jgi:hypothetical protein